MWTWFIVVVPNGFGIGIFALVLGLEEIWLFRAWERDQGSVSAGFGVW